LLNVLIELFYRSFWETSSIFCSCCQVWKTDNSRSASRILQGLLPMTC